MRLGSASRCFHVDGFVIGAVDGYVEVLCALEAVKGSLRSLVSSEI